MLEQPPFFSIIIPTFNREKFIIKAIESVVSQTFDNWELLIIDDGSTDNTNEVIQSFNDKRIIYKYQENQERSIARNNGIKYAKGEWICFLDSDDEFLPNHLNVFFKIINCNSKKIQFFYSLKTNESFIHNENKFDLIFSSSIHSQQVCINKKVFSEHYFNPNRKIGEDLELWMKIICKYDVMCSMKKTVVIHDHEERTIRQKTVSPSMMHLNLIKELTSKFSALISKNIQKKALSRAFFNVATFYIYNSEKIKSIKYLLLSLISYPKSNLTKHKLLLLLSLIHLHSKKILFEYK